MDLHWLVALLKSVCGLCSKHTKARQNKSVISYWLIRYWETLFIPIAAPDLKTHHSGGPGPQRADGHVCRMAVLCRDLVSCCSYHICVQSGLRMWQQPPHQHTGKQWAPRSCTINIRVGSHWVWIRAGDWEALTSLIRCNCNYWYQFTLSTLWD